MEYVNREVPPPTIRDVQDPDTFGAELRNGRLEVLNHNTKMVIREPELIAEDGAAALNLRKRGC